MPNAALKYFLVLILATAYVIGTEAQNGTAGNGDEENKDVGSVHVFPCAGMRVVKMGDKYTWYKGQHVVTSYRAKINRSEAKLALEAVLRDGEGSYRCRVIEENKAPEPERIMEIDVLVPSMNVSIRTDNNDVFEAGTPRVLACIVYGSEPSPNVTWSIGDTMLRPNVYKEVNRGNFTVSSLTFVPSLTDNGKELVCKATNRHTASIYEDRVTVSVGQRPMCVDNGFKTIGAVEGDTETLVCMVESDPEPEQFIWTFADGRTIYTSSKKVSGHKTRYSSTMIWVPREDDFGPLYCRASNRFGEQKQACTFSVLHGGPPATPECEAFWADQETLKVRCDKNWDGGRPQTIHFEVMGPDGVRKLSRKSHEFEVTSLHPGGNISAKVYSSSSRGRSSTIQLSLPPGPHGDDMPPEITRESVETRTQVILTGTIVIALAMVAMTFVIYAFYIILKHCCKEYCSFGGSESESSQAMENFQIQGRQQLNEYQVQEPLPASRQTVSPLAVEYYCV